MRALVAASLIFMLVAPSRSGAYETDQFSHRLDPISDSTRLLDDKVNQTIQDIVSNWKGPRDDRKFTDQVFHRIGGHHWVDKIERWAMKSPEIGRLQTSRRKSIYQGIPIWATRFAGVFGVGPTIKVNGQLIGSDKLGHFLSQGRKFFRRYQATHDEAKAADQSAFTERAIFGQMTTGIYSNADLVANYEGYRFYRSLFEDNIVGDKPAIVAWRDNQWKIQRPFTWADYVNPYWDEALNINHYDRVLYPYIKEQLQAFCPDYYAAPEMFIIEDEQALQDRYAALQLRDTSDLRMDHLCHDIPGENLRGVAAGRAQ
jgi:hypothetical protein